MNDDVLKDLLSDVLKEQKENSKTLADLITLVGKAISQPSERSSSEKDRTVTLSDQSLSLFRNELNTCAKKIQNLTSNIPSDLTISHTTERNLVLFSKRYNDGEYNLRDLLNWTSILIVSCVFLYTSIRYLPDYFERRSESQAYKNTMLWFYYKAPERDRKSIKTIVNKFYLGDSTVTNQLDRFIKKETINP